MASTIVVPSAVGVWALTPEVAASKVSSSLEPEASIAKAVIDIATAAIVDINALQISVAAGGGGGPGGYTVWSADSAVTSSSYGNGLRYVPMRDAQDDYIQFQLLAGATGTLSFLLRYAMSSASSNVVRLRVDSLTMAAGGNPSTALTTGTAFTVTPGSDTLAHDVTSSDSANLSFAVTAGDTVVVKISRLALSDAADTHAGDFRAIDVRVA